MDRKRKKKRKKREREKMRDGGKEMGKYYFA